MACVMVSQLGVRGFVYYRKLDWDHPKLVARAGQGVVSHICPSVQEGPFSTWWAGHLVQGHEGRDEEQRFPGTVLHSGLAGRLCGLSSDKFMLAARHCCIMLDWCV